MEPCGPRPNPDQSMKEIQTEYYKCEQFVIFGERYELIHFSAVSERLKQDDLASRIWVFAVVNVFLKVKKDCSHDATTI